MTSSNNKDRYERSILVLYRILNHDNDNSDDLFDAFYMHSDKTQDIITLSQVQRNCCAFNKDTLKQYHWRVCVEDIPAPGEIIDDDDEINPRRPMYTWWDIQDADAALPIMEKSSQEMSEWMHNMQHPNQRRTNHRAVSAAKAVKGAWQKSIQMGKAMLHHHRNQQNTLNNNTDDRPKQRVLAFHVLDLTQMKDCHGRIHDCSCYQNHRQEDSMQPSPYGEIHGTEATSASSGEDIPTTMPPECETTVSSPTPPVKLPQDDLIDFSSDGPLDDACPFDKPFSEEMGTFTCPLNIPNNEMNKTNQNDGGQNTINDIDEDLNMPETQPEEAGKTFRLDQATQVAQAQATQDEIRKCWEPKVKLWSEEHGQKKQIRALLATLHTILWPGAQWKPVSIGDILDDKKCATCYRKAALVVHPDRLHGLDEEKCFLAQRIFDALSQAKAEFDNNQTR